MSLDKSSLASDIQAVWQSYPETVADAAAGMWSAYESYAKQAETITGGSVASLAPGGASMLEAALKAMDAGAVAAAWETACVAAWAGALLSPGSKAVPPGTSVVLEVVAVPGVPGTLSSGLKSAFEDTEGDMASKAKDIADALHTFTGTVMTMSTQLVPSPGGPVPMPLPPAPVK